MAEPQALGAIGPSALARIMAGIRDRNLTHETGPVNQAPNEDEPGHPRYHHRARAAFALSRWNTAVPHRYANATTTHPDIQAWADRAAANIHDAGFLVINGAIGTGKTHQAYGALRRIAETGPHRFEMIAVTAPDMYGRLRPGGSDKGSEHELKQYARIQLLLLDDIGTEKLSEFTEEATYRIVNARYNSGLPLIITTNLLVRDPAGSRASDLVGRLGDRLASRLAQAAHVVTLDGPDLRRQDAS
jgi:DNA replication protein DnaC